MWNMVWYLTAQALRSVPSERSDEHGVAGVDVAGDVGVAAGAEDRSGAGVGVDAGKGRPALMRKAAVRVGDGLGVVEEEGARGGVELPLRAAKDEGAELE